MAFIYNLARTCQLSTTIVALYDHIITFDQEVQLAWDRPWCFAKFSFLWIRYFGSLFLLAQLPVLFIKPPSNEFCRAWFTAHTWGTVIIIWSMQYVMMLRTWAMFHNSRKIVIPCLVAFGVEAFMMATFFGFSLSKIQLINEPFPGLHICTPSYTPYYHFAFWIPVVVFDGILLVLALYRYIERAQSVRGLESPRNHIWRVLVIDNLIYFVITAVVCIASGVVWLSLPIRWRSLPRGFSLAASCITGSRLVMNLRKAYFSPATHLAPDMNAASSPSSM